MPAFLGATGHAASIMRVVERHDPFPRKLSVFGFSVWAKWVEQKVEKVVYSFPQKTSSQRVDGGQPTQPCVPRDAPHERRDVAREAARRSRSTGARPRASRCGFLLGVEAGR